MTSFDWQATKRDEEGEDWGWQQSWFGITKYISFQEETRDDTGIGLWRIKTYHHHREDNDYQRGDRIDGKRYEERVHWREGHGIRRTREHMVSTMECLIEVKRERIHKTIIEMSLQRKEKRVLNELQGMNWTENWTENGRKNRANDFMKNTWEEKKKSFSGTEGLRNQGYYCSTRWQWKNKPFG